ncbi:MAG: DUF3489 domain-containing protein [Janthinobacterium lividum]
MTTEPNALMETSPRKRTGQAAMPAVLPTKSASVIKLLQRARGATSLELTAATDWQPHSVRAFLSGLRKKGRPLVREPRKSGELAYRLMPAATAPVVQPTNDGADA